MDPLKSFDEIEVADSKVEEEKFDEKEILKTHRDFEEE